MQGISATPLGARLSIHLALSLAAIATVVIPLSPAAATAAPSSPGVLAQGSGADLAQQADQLLQQGIQQFNSGQTQAALETFEKELALRRQLNDREGEWRSLGWIGRIL